LQNISTYFKLAIGIPVVFADNCLIKIPPVI